MKTITLAGTKKGTISIQNIDEPYGAGSKSVASIAISLSGTEPDWKVHLPYENLDDVIEALKELQSKN